MTTELGAPSDGWPRVRQWPHAGSDMGSRRLCVVLGAAGWGKTTAVASWASRDHSVWPGSQGRHDAACILDALRKAVEPDGPGPVIDVPTDTGDADHLGAMAAHVGEWLRGALTHEVVFVVDDVQRLPPRSGAVRLLEGLCWYAPDLFRIVLVSRRELPFSLARLRGQGLVTDIDASDLAFTPSEIAAILGQTDTPGATLAEQVWEWTGGWPAAVQAAAEVLPRVGPGEYAEALQNLVHPGERLHTYMTEEVVGTEPRWVQDLLRRMAVFGGVTSPATIGGEARDPAAVLADLTRRGFLRRTSGEVSSWRLLPPLADYFRHETVMPRTERAGLLAAAAGECMARGAYGQALRHLVAAGDHERTASLLIDYGADPMPSGDTDAVLRAAELATQPADDVRLQQTLDEARQVRGLWRAAFDSYQRAAGNDDQLRPELGWRIIWMLTMQGEFGKIPSLLENVALEREDALDEAWLLAQVATAHRMVGDLHNSRRFAHQALARARRCGRSSAYGPVHNVLAMLAAADGDRRNVDAHFANALEIAASENDLVQQLWVRVTRAVHLLEMGLPRDAAAEAGPLRALGQKCEVPFLEAHARTTFAQASLRLGALDTAAEELTAAIELFQRLGSRFLAWPLSGLGDLHRIRGQLERARAAYEEALTTAVGGPDSIGSSHALMGLARVRAADDLPLARRLADRAVAMSEPLHQAAALLTRGWVALLGGDRTAAATDAARAGAVARRRRDDLGLAEAILLSVQASDSPSTDVDLLTEAIQIWQETGCILDEAAARMAAGSFGGPSARLEADRAVQTLRASGVDIESRRAAGPLAVLLRCTPTVSIQALGVFQVIRDGAPVPKGEWQSKKARDLLKILVALRRPTSRDRLAELLWPDTDPGKSANRLSVLLSTVRDILEPRPGESSPLMSDGSVVWLDSSRVRIDVEEFMERADAALNAYRSGGCDAPELLMSALAAHSGELFEDDPYQDWAGQLAEEIRAKQCAVLRALVSSFRASRDVDRVIEVGLRLLEQDPYDEEVRLDLVAALLEAGRLGEARRHHAIYAERMQEIDIEPRPMPHPRRPSAPLPGGPRP